MTKRLLWSAAVAAALAASPAVLGQTQGGGAPAATAFKAPRTPWGDPDIQGLWPSTRVARRAGAARREIRHAQRAHGGRVRGARAPSRRGSRVGCRRVRGARHEAGRESAIVLAGPRHAEDAGVADRRARGRQAPAAHARGRAARGGARRRGRRPMAPRTRGSTGACTSVASRAAQ